MSQTSCLRGRLVFFPLKLLFLALFLPLTLLAQEKTISGTITDTTGFALFGISVTVQNSKVGTSSDSKGKFTIRAAVGATLVFTSTGYDVVSVVVDNRDDYSVILTAKVNALTDVVVVGYGRTKKVNLLGAVGTITVDEKLNTRSLPNVSSALSGLIPGLSAIQNSGMAGNNGAALLIRGMGTVNNASPLIVVDGMPDVDINRINMNDIESISVLKDAASASVYGSRAANGVILVTTKTGKGAKKTAITVNSNMALEKPVKGISFMADYPRSLTLSQFRGRQSGTAIDQLSFKNGTIDQWMALGMIDPLRYPNTDWWNVIMQDGAYQNYNVSATGGNDKSNFFISVGTKDERGLQINNEYKQYNARFNFDYKIKNNMNAGARFSGNWSKWLYALENGFTSGDASGGDLRFAVAGITPYDPASGKYGGVMADGEDPQAFNPYTNFVNNLNRRTRQEANGNMYWDWTPIKGLTATIDFSLNYYNQFSYNAAIPNQAWDFQTNQGLTRHYVATNAGISNNTNTGYKTMATGRLNYTRNFGTDHTVSALAVYSEEYWYDRSQSGGRADRLHPSLTEIDAALTGDINAGGSSSTEGLRSYIGRVNYSAYNKYLLEGNFRVDGSSKFLKGSQYGFFPSVGLGWRFTEENFMKFTDRVLSSGKFRITYGGLGNNSGVGRFEQQETLTFNGYVVGDQLSLVRGFTYNKLVNRNLTWETTTVLNVGLELGFFDNRLTAELDYYDRLTTDMNRPTDLSILISGAYNPAPRNNIGNLRNRGVEGTFSWKDKVAGFNYGVTVNASYNLSKLEKWNEYIGRGSTSGGSNIFINMPYDFVYAYEAIGIAQTWQDVYNATPQGAQPGDILRKDLNGDGRIDANDRKAFPFNSIDRPSTFFSLNGYVSWKGFDVAVLLQGSAGRKDFWLNEFNQTNFSDRRYATSWDHWTKPWNLENRNGEWPRLGGAGGNREPSTYWLDDMSFLRVKNLQVGYSVPARLLKKVGVYSLRIAGTAENLATITSYRGLDPEKSGNANNVYPINKAYSLSIQLGL